MSTSKKYDRKVGAFRNDLNEVGGEYNTFCRAFMLSERRIRKITNDDSFIINSKKEVNKILDSLNSSKEKWNEMAQINPRDCKKLPLDFLYDATQGTNKTGEDIAEELSTNNLRTSFGKMQATQDWLWNMEHEYFGCLSTLLAGTQFEDYLTVQMRRNSALHIKDQLDKVREELAKFESSDPYADQDDLSTIEQKMSDCDRVIAYADNFFAKLSDKIEEKDPDLANKLYEEEFAIYLPTMFDEAAMPYISELLDECKKDDTFQFFLDNSDITVDKETESILARLEDEAGIKNNSNLAFGKRVSRYKFEK